MKNKKKLAEKLSKNTVKKDKIQQSITKEIVAQTFFPNSQKLKNDLKELNVQIAEAKRLEEQKQRESEEKPTEKNSDMSYQKAEKIRNKSFGTLLAEQEGGLGQSFKKALSLKTQAKVKGIKESFDPMNIAKVLTGGSNWAPAMLGKLRGRNKEDIARFTGARLSQMGGGDTATRIPKLHDNDEMVGILSKILEFLQQTNNDDTKNREELGNYAEELKAEKDKRFQELLAALKGLSIGASATKVENTTNNTSGGLSITDFIPGLAPGTSSLAALAGLVGGILVGGAAATVFSTGVLASPSAESFRKNLQDNSMLGAVSGDTALAAGILDANQGQTPEQIRARQEEKKAALADTGLATRIYGVGETEALKKKGYTQEQIDALRGDTEAKKQAADDAKSEQLIKSFDAKGGDLTKATMEELEAKKAQQIDYGYAKGDLVKAINTEIQNRKQKSATPAPASSSSAGAIASGGTGGGSAMGGGAGDGGGSEAGGGTASATSGGSSSGQKLNAATSENLQAKLDDTGEIGASNIVVNNVNKRTAEKTPKDSGIPFVRNQESTFRQMIYNSTRVV